MTIITLPIGDSPDSEYRIKINDTPYNFRFRWNSYDESWQCYIGLLGRDPIIKFKLTNGFDLLRQFRYIPDIPNAIMFVMDIFSDKLRIDYDNVGPDDGKIFKVIIDTLDG